jgi:hypothetical protein
MNQAQQVYANIKRTYASKAQTPGDNDGSNAPQDVGRGGL